METPTTANSAIASRFDSMASFPSMVHRAHCAVVQLRQRTARRRSCTCDGDRPVNGCIRVACPPSSMNAPNRAITGHPTKEATPIARGGFIAWPRACAAGCRIQQQEQATCESCRTLACRSDASTDFTRSAAEVVMLIPTTPIRANAFQSNVMCTSIYPSGARPAHRFDFQLRDRHYGRSRRTVSASRESRFQNTRNPGETRCGGR
jgi:hypothetical protein